MLPPEVAEVLRGLQKEAPRVPAEVMEYEIRGSLENFDELFEELDFEAFAAASIGQVHRGRLRDGREVAVKIQYPLIDEIVKADLKNLKTLLRALLGLITDLDFEPVWSELRDRLLEELDYTHEAENIRRMAELHVDVPEIVIPEGRGGGDDSQCADDGVRRGHRPRPMPARISSTRRCATDGASSWPSS